MSFSGYWFFTWISVKRSCKQPHKGHSRWSVNALRIMPLNPSQNPLVILFMETVSSKGYSGTVSRQQLSHSTGRNRHVVTSAISTKFSRKRNGLKDLDKYSRTLNLAEKTIVQRLLKGRGQGNNECVLRPCVLLCVGVLICDWFVCALPL